ncbi:hypothetical protein MP638_004683 [Amoeboaphelidium occidentale]|nr:hypothetical protein MP638_004683 [Amoeboaphelidium occidentale]
MKSDCSGGTDCDSENSSVRPKSFSYFYPSDQKVLDLTQNVTSEQGPKGQ